MKENRERILHMVKEGLISVEEAASLLEALEGLSAETVAMPMKDKRGRKGRRLRVVVDAQEGEDKGKGRANVNITLPLSLVKALGPAIMNNLPGEAKVKMEEAGVDAQGIMDIIATLDDMEEFDEDIVNVDAGEGPDRANVRIYVE